MEYNRHMNGWGWPLRLNLLPSKRSRIVSGMPLDLIPLFLRCSFAWVCCEACLAKGDPICDDVDRNPPLAWTAYLMVTKCSLYGVNKFFNTRPNPASTSGRTQTQPTWPLPSAPIIFLTFPSWLTDYGLRSNVRALSQLISTRQACQCQCPAYPAKLLQGLSRSHVPTKTRTQTFIKSHVPSLAPNAPVLCGSDLKFPTLLLVGRHFSITLVPLEPWKTKKRARIITSAKVPVEPGLCGLSRVSRFPVTAVQMRVRSTGQRKGRG